MYLNLVSMDVDLREYPTEITPVTPFDEITFGDGHGHTLKIIYLLIKTGIMTLENGAEDFKELWEIYEQELDPGSTDYQPYLQAMGRFIHILQYAKPGAAGLVRFLGDMKGDRGNNDLFTLLVYEWLLLADIPVETLISNHDLAFNSVVLNKEYDPDVSLKKGFDRLPYDIMRSTLGALFFLHNQLFCEKWFMNLYTMYRSTLKLFSYTIKPDNHFELYTHAAVGLETVYAFFMEYLDRLPKDLLIELDLLQDEDIPRTYFYNLNAQKLARVIDALNAVFVKLDLLKAIENERYILEMSYPKGLPLNVPEDFPLFRLCWNRDIGGLERGNAVNLTLIHGHDTCSPTWGVSLDNALGKNSKGGLIYLNESWYNHPQGGLAKLEAYRYGLLALPGTEIRDLEFSYVLHCKEPALKKSLLGIGFFKKGTLPLPKPPAQKPTCSSLNFEAS